MVEINDKVLKFQKAFGLQSAAAGRYIRPLDVVPTGILALDYALGTGGWPSGSIIEVYGLPDAGKTLLALQGIREAQKLGKICGYIAAEPGYDSAWAAKHGVDLERLLVSWPDDGKEAFEHLQMMVLDDDIEFIVFDSIGALLRASETEIDGNMAAGGQAGLITWGVKRAWTAAYKRNKYVIFLNQVRDVMSARFPTLDSPGGHALKHASEIRVYLRPGTEKFTIQEGDNKILVGQEVIAEIKRTKRDQGTGKRAVYNMFTMETDEFPFGVDRVTDVINTGKRTGVIEQAGAWFKYVDFPDGKLQGKDAVAKWLKENPEKIDSIREKIIGAIR